MPLLYTPENMHVGVSTVPPAQLVVALGAVRDAAGRVLVARRVETSIPDAAGKWEFVGGKIAFGEAPELAVVREVREESGLVVRVRRLLPHVFTHVWRTAEGGQLQVFLLTYECELVDGELDNHLVADEIHELRFVTLTELRALPALPNVHEAIQYL